MRRCRRASRMPAVRWKRLSAPPCRRACSAPAWQAMGAGRGAPDRETPRRRGGRRGSPIVALEGASPAQYQLLLRRRQADGTVLAPGQVIPAAEAAGRIADLDQQVMDHALGLLDLYRP